MSERDGLYLRLTKNRNRQRQEISKHSQVALERLIPACNTILDVCLSLVNRASEQPFEGNHSLTPNMFLAAQFLQGEDITRATIFVGAYHQAANLLKQQTEILAAMYEVRSGTRTEGKNANFKEEMKKFGRKYGELNDIAHPTNADVVELFAAKVKEGRVDPALEIQFKQEFCLNFFGYHSLLIAQFSEELRMAMEGILGNKFSEDENDLVVDAIKNLAANGAFSLRSKEA